MRRRWQRFLKNHRIRVRSLYVPLVMAAISNWQGQRFSFEKITQPAALQQKALDLAGVSLICTQ